VIAFIFRVDTPWRYVSAKADTNAFPDFWYLSKLLWNNVPADPEVSAAQVSPPASRRPE